ncbi:hypothetical protein Golob_025319 [Gossypium lobatum]|uniref:Uncharacterized protein n=1 Tax=Gossypium lobatum TaxID=34289 RepID=A0A7J8NE36_9ROSI|nr:hypothetical protein [Gossypium lobatum]
MITAELFLLGRGLSARV